MSTHCYIAKQIGSNSYRTIFCKLDGYLEVNGSILAQYYTEDEKVDQLLELGDLWSLGCRLHPDPDKPHTYWSRQRDVTFAFNRDLGEKDTEAQIMTLQELDNADDYAEYAFVFNEDKRWQYFRIGESQYGLFDLQTALDHASIRYVPYAERTTIDRCEPDLEQEEINSSGMTMA